MPCSAKAALRPGAWKSRFMGPTCDPPRPLATTAPRAVSGAMDTPTPDAPLTIAEFDRVDIRVGTIVDAKPFPEARKPAIRLHVDFGEPIGVKSSSAQITAHYSPDRLIGRQVLAVVNFPPRRIGPFLSEVLVLGVPDENGAVVLLQPGLKVPDGGRLF